jgi:hypothetical protein
MAEAKSKDVFLRPAARLVDAVLRFGGSGNALAMSPAHAAHYSEWRRLIEEHLREFPDRGEAGMTKAEVEDDEARLSAHMDIIGALQTRIFAVPAQTWGDVMLYAEVFWWHYWAGVDLEGPDAQSQLEGGPMSIVRDEDLAKLLGAIVRVRASASSQGEGIDMREPPNSNLPPPHVLEALRRPRWMRDLFLLTPAEIAALRREAKETSAYAQKAFAHLQPVTTPQPAPSWTADGAFKGFEVD